MEAKDNEKLSPKVKKSGFFTKISTKEEAEKPIKSISNLFFILGVLNFIFGIYFIFYKTGSIKSPIWFGLSSTIIGLVFFISAYQLKKYKSMASAICLIVFSCIAIIGVIISVAKGGSTILAILLYLLAFFSSIDAIRIVKKLEEL